MQRESLLLRFEFSDVKALGLAFLLGFAVRMVPEVLAFQYPIGFDTVGYAVRLKNGVVWSHWSSFFTSSWLFYGLTVPLYSVFGGDPFLWLKFLGPVFYGLNVAGVYWFGRRLLGWDGSVCFLAAGFFVFQLAALRISWDLLRNTLGLGILLFALSFVRSVGPRRGFVCFVLLSLLCVFAHEYAAVTLFSVVFGLVLLSLVRGEGLGANRQLLLGVLPALAVFLAGFYLRLFPVGYSVETNVLSAGDVVAGGVGRLFFLTNYLRVVTSVDVYASYFDLVLSVVVLFCLLYLPYVFFVWKGFFRNRVLSCWTCLLLVGSFGCLFVPFAALQYWHRWMFMLVYPFTFYAVNFVSKCWSGVGIFRGFCDRKVRGMVLLTVLLGGLYLATPVLMSTINAGIFSVVPASRYISFAPTVPYQDVDGVVEAMEWLNGNMGENDCVVLQHAFLFWGQFYLDEAHRIVHCVVDVDLAVNTALNHGFNRVFFVWWNTPIGWYDVAVSVSFDEVVEFGRISVYEYVG